MTPIDFTNNQNTIRRVILSYIYTLPYLIVGGRRVGYNTKSLKKNTTHFHLLTHHQTKFFTKKSIYPRLLELPPN